MNKIIENQLRKCESIDFTKLDLSQTTFIFNKREDIKLKENNIYLIELHDKMLDSKNIININWNKGDCPKYPCYKADISRIMGKMLYVNALAYDYEKDEDLNEIWSGWISKDLVNIIKEL